MHGPERAARSIRERGSTVTPSQRTGAARSSRGRGRRRRSCRRCRPSRRRSSRTARGRRASSRRGIGLPADLAAQVHGGGHDVVEGVQDVGVLLGAEGVAGGSLAAAVGVLGGGPGVPAGAADAHLHEADAAGAVDGAPPGAGAERRLLVGDRGEQVGVDGVDARGLVEDGDQRGRDAGAGLSDLARAAACRGQQRERCRDHQQQGEHGRGRRRRSRGVRGRGRRARRPQPRGRASPSARLPAFVGEALQGAPGVAALGFEDLGAARQVADRVGGGQAVFGRADAQGDGAATAGAVDPVGLRVGALDGLQPRDGGDSRRRRAARRP